MDGSLVESGVETLCVCDKRLHLLAGENAVGRGDKNDIILDDQSVSDNHAVITVLPGGASILVKDLDSTNKTRYQATEDASWEVIKVRKLSHHVRVTYIILILHAFIIVHAHLPCRGWSVSHQSNLKKVGRLISGRLCLKTLYRRRSP